MPTRRGSVPLDRCVRRRRRLRRYFTPSTSPTDDECRKDHDRHDHGHPFGPECSGRQDIGVDIGRSAVRSVFGFGPTRAVARSGAVARRASAPAVAVPGGVGSVDSSAGTGSKAIHVPSASATSGQTIASADVRTRAWRVGRSTRRRDIVDDEARGHTGVGAEGSRQQHERRGELLGVAALGVAEEAIDQVPLQARRRCTAVRARSRRASCARWSSAVRAGSRRPAASDSAKPVRPATVSSTGRGRHRTSGDAVDVGCDVRHDSDGIARARAVRSSRTTVRSRSVSTGCVDADGASRRAG